MRGREERQEKDGRGWESCILLSVVLTAYPLSVCLSVCLFVHPSICHIVVQFQQKDTYNRAVFTKWLF